MRRPRLRIACARLLQKTLKRLGRQATTAPGRVLLRLCPDILEQLCQGKSILLVTGTNGKTTTVSILVRLLRTAGYSVRTNASGANLATGLITCLMQDQKSADVWVLEIDEAAFARWADAIRPLGVLVTNVFRDQLDRYGEMATVFHLLQKGVETANPDLLVLNGDDPLVADLQFLHKGLQATFGMDLEGFSTADVDLRGGDWSSDLDTTSCPRCGHSLAVRTQTVGHLGDFGCGNCGFHRCNPNYRAIPWSGEKLLLRHCDSDCTEKLNQTAERNQIEECSYPAETLNSMEVIFPLRGLYNVYNVLAAWAFADQVQRYLRGQPLDQFLVRETLEQVRPAFGRQERIPVGEGRSLCLLLSKNPDGLQQNFTLLQQVEDLGAAVFCMNSRLADGCDFSWIWDAPFERFEPLSVPIFVSGERAGDLMLRLAHAGYSLQPDQYYEEPLRAVEAAVAASPSGSCIYILVNYTAMLALRQSLGSRYDFNWKWEEN